MTCVRPAGSNMAYIMLPIDTAQALLFWCLAAGGRHHTPPLTTSPPASRAFLLDAAPSPGPSVTTPGAPSGWTSNDVPSGAPAGISGRPPDAPAGEIPSVTLGWTSSTPSVRILDGSSGGPSNTPSDVTSDGKTGGLLGSVSSETPDVPSGMTSRFPLHTSVTPGSAAFGGTSGGMPYAISRTSGLPFGGILHLSRGTPHVSYGTPSTISGRPTDIPPPRTSDYPPAGTSPIISGRSTDTSPSMTSAGTSARPPVIKQPASGTQEALSTRARDGLLTGTLSPLGRISPPTPTTGAATSPTFSSSLAARTYSPAAVWEPADRPVSPPPSPPSPPPSSPPPQSTIFLWAPSHFADDGGGGTLVVTVVSSDGPLPPGLRVDLAFGSGAVVASEPLPPPHRRRSANVSFACPPFPRSGRARALLLARDDGVLAASGVVEVNRTRRGHALSLSRHPPRDGGARRHRPRWCEGTVVAALEPEPCRPPARGRVTAFARTLPFGRRGGVSDDDDDGDDDENGVAEEVLLGEQEMRGGSWEAEFDCSLFAAEAASTFYCFRAIASEVGDDGGRGEGGGGGDGGGDGDVRATKCVQASLHLPANGTPAAAGPLEGGLWGPWSPWSPCSASCGEGTRERRRTCAATAVVVAAAVATVATAAQGAAEGAAAVAGSRGAAATCGGEPDAPWSERESSPCSLLECRDRGGGVGDENEGRRMSPAVNDRAASRDTPPPPPAQPAAPPSTPHGVVESAVAVFGMCVCACVVVSTLLAAARACVARFKPGGGGGGCGAEAGGVALSVTGVCRGVAPGRSSQLLPSGEEMELDALRGSESTVAARSSGRTVPASTSFTEASSLVVTEVPVRCAADLPNGSSWLLAKNDSAFASGVLPAPPPLSPELPPPRPISAISPPPPFSFSLAHRQLRRMRRDGQTEGVRTYRFVPRQPPPPGPVGAPCLASDEDSENGAAGAAGFAAVGFTLPSPAKDRGAGHRKLSLPALADARWALAPTPPTTMWQHEWRAVPMARWLAVGGQAGNWAVPLQLFPPPPAAAAPAGSAPLCGECRRPLYFAGDGDGDDNERVLAPAIYPTFRGESRHSLGAVDDATFHQQQFRPRKGSCGVLRGAARRLPPLPRAPERPSGAGSESSAAATSAGSEGSVAERSPLHRIHQRLEGPSFSHSEV